MSQARKDAARARAKRAVQDVTDTESRMIYLDEYSASYSGSSISSVLSRHFVRHHGIETSDGLWEFFDTETGALVILPKSTKLDVGPTDTDGRRGGD